MGFNMVSKEKKEKLKKDAIKHFGLTDNCRKAGFILDDGKMLDFTDLYDPNGERMDHTMIGQIQDKEISKPDDFIEKTDSIRFYQTKKSMAIDIPDKVTKAQLDKVEDCICQNKGKYLIVSRYEQKEYGYPMFKRITEDFDSSGDCMQDSKELKKRVAKIDRRKKEIKGND